jgi:hypothetical protein
VEERHGVNSGPIAPRAAARLGFIGGRYPPAAAATASVGAALTACRDHLQHLCHRPQREVLLAGTR